jgi:hypothetical protein
MKNPVRHPPIISILRSALWPALGALCGFTLFYLFMPIGLFVIEHLNDKVPEFAITAIATLIAAWAGGWAAFKAERDTQTMNRRNGQISAANRAIFKIAQVYTVFENLRQYTIEPYRTNSNRARSMDSPQPGMLPDITFNFDELSFMLDHPGEAPQALNELMLLEWKYRVLLITVEHRARAAEAHARGDHLALNMLSGLTDQMVTSVDDGLSDSKDTYRQILTTLAKLYPDQTFLRISTIESSDSQNSH